MTSLRVKRLSLDALLLALAMILSYVETVLPLSFIIPLPGVKMGLANVAVTLCFFFVSPVDAFGISILRISLTALLFGNVSSFFFALSGGIFAYLGLWAGKLFYKWLSFYGISVMCAALHGLGQCVAASVILSEAAIFGYLPIMLVFSLLFGLLTGVIVIRLTRLFKNA